MKPARQLQDQIRWAATRARRGTSRVTMTRSKTASEARRPTWGAITPRRALDDYSAPNRAKLKIG